MPFWSRKPTAPDPTLGPRAEAARALEAPLADPLLGPFRAACAGRAGHVGDVLEIHGAEVDGPEVALRTNVGDLRGTLGDAVISVRHMDRDGHTGDTIVTLERDRAQALMDHAAGHPVALAALLLLEQVNTSQSLDFLGWFWPDLAGSKQTDAVYVLRTDADLLYAMRLGRWGASLFAYAGGQAATTPMAELSPRALTKAAEVHGFDVP